MESNIRKLIKEKGVMLFLIDIDGTLKDLTKEHMQVINDFLVVNNNKKKRLILKINGFFMGFVKSGLFPTNKHTQAALCYINAILFNEKYLDFKKEYLQNYSELRIIFDRCYEMLDEIEKNGAKYILVSKNEQSINFIKNNERLEKSILKISLSKGNKKDTFKNAIEFHKNEYQNTIRDEQIVVIGDNFWDDIVPAMFLGIRFLWCNKYKSKVKKTCNLLLLKSIKLSLTNIEELSIW